MSILNKQPVFTATPIISTLDGATFGSLYPDAYNSGVSIYTDSSTYGTMITRVTITPGTLAGSTLSTCLFALGVYRGIVKTGYFTGGVIGTSYQPSLVFTFDPPLVLPSGMGLFLISSNPTDKYFVLVEGATYDQPL